MKFMVTFKTSMEKNMGELSRDINKKIDEKLSNLDSGLVNLTREVRNNDTKQEELSKKIEKQHKEMESRLKKLEIDAGRARYARMKQNNDIGKDGKNGRNLPTGRRTEQGSTAGRQGGLNQ